MITTLRHSLKSNAYRVFLWLFLVIMIVGGLSLDFTDKSKWAIKVYDQKVTDVQWRHSLMNAQKRLDYIASLGINWPRTESLEKEVLRSLVSKLLVQKNAHELGLIAPSILIQDQVAVTLQNLPAHFFDAAGNLNITMLEQQIAPLTFEDFLTEIEGEIKSNLINSILDLSSSYVPHFEIASQYNEDYADKKYTAINFSLDKAVEKAEQNKASNEVLERFYKKSEHGDAYKTPEKRSGTLWKFNAHDYGIQISPQEIATYYDEHKQSDYLETPLQLQVRTIVCNGQADSREKIEAIYEQVKADPSSFAVIAKKINADKEKGQKSNLTEFFSKDSKELDALVVDTAFEQLHKDLDVSDIIKTETGYEILQRVAKKSARYKPLLHLKDQITSVLIDQKFAKRFKQDAERLTGHAHYNNNQAVESFIEKRKGHKEHLALEAKKPGSISMHLFQTDKDAYAVFIDGKHGILLQCADISKKTLKPFHEVASVVAADYYKKQAQQDLQTFAEQAMKDACTISLDKIAQEHGAKLSHQTFTYKDGKSEFSELLRRPEIAQKIKALHAVGEMMHVVTSTESFLIVLDEVAPVDKNILDEKELMIKNTLVSKAKYKGRDSFIASLYRRGKLNSKIEIKDQLLKDAKETV